jgi:hypothetical protein
MSVSGSAVVVQCVIVALAVLLLLGLFGVRVRFEC